MIERAILDAVARLRAAGDDYLLATAICQRGSAYRRAGARLVLAGERRVAGGISGGCLEGDLANRGWWRLGGREAVVITYDSRHAADADDDEVRAAFAVGCNGVVDVMLESRPSAGRIDPIAIAELCVRTQRRGAIATIYRGAGPIGARIAIVAGGELAADPAFPSDLRRALAGDLSRAIATGESWNCVCDGVEVFVEALVPPPRLFVFGTGPDAAPVIALARALGWDAFACAPHVRPAVRERFLHADALIVGPPATLVAQIDAAARAACVVMAHDYELDRAHLCALLDSRATYVGVLGPRARTARMLADLGRRGDARLHAPIGLDLGAETPEEIALAITGEIQAVLAGVPHRSLRDRTGSIHRHSTSPALPLDAPAERIACG